MGMTTPYERTRALLQTREFLRRKAALGDPDMRAEAKALLRHYPGLVDIEAAHTASPDVFGPVPPFSRLSGGETTQAAADASRESVREPNRQALLRVTKPMTDAETEQAFNEHYPGGIEHADISPEDYAQIEELHSKTGGSK
jgi:hypothetical protein